MNIKVVIDTNVLVSSLSRKSKYNYLIDLIYNNKIDIVVTSEILLEYEEILSSKYSKLATDNFFTLISELENAQFVNVYFNWNLLTDTDDNKFVDCYVAANAELLITNDKGFNQLNNVEFPRINIISLEDFLNNMR